jgi:hypothetical protein
MVRCLDCCNLTKSWIPTSKPEWLFDEKWKCKITGTLFDMYYLVEKERYCNDYGKHQTTEHKT